MNELAEFMATLLNMGMKREQVVERGYDFALAQEMSLHKEGSPVTTNAMWRAAHEANKALSEAYHIYNVHNRMR